MFGTAIQDRMYFLLLRKLYLFKALYAHVDGTT